MRTGSNYSVKKESTIADFQKFVDSVYALPDDRLYSIWDLLVQEQRFAMRALKGIRKGNTEKVKSNLLISFSWLMAIANRLHVDIEKDLWRRFPGLCSYCGSKPCACKTEKISERKKVSADDSLKPKNMSGFQKMFEEIYPASERTLADAGVHLAEEVGEMSEAIHNFLGQHLEEQFNEVELEMSDFVSNVFGVANSAGFDVAEELAKIFNENCHVCHKAPCECSFTSVVNLRT